MNLVLSPSSLPNKIYTAAQTRELDQTAITKCQISARVLMRRAGQAAYTDLCRTWPHAQSITVICGMGNNAGDGYVLAECAKQDGKKVTVLSLVATDKLCGEAKASYLSAKNSGLEVTNTPTLEPSSQTDVIVDALLGTGLNKAVSGAWKTMIENINAHPAPVLALDIPSGLHADRGTPFDIAVHATVTSTFIGVKQGLLTGQAGNHVGKLLFHNLDVPDTLYQTYTKKTVSRIDWSSCSTNPQPRKKDSHKGNFGHVLIVGGDKGYMGAVQMAATAAARCGAGLVSVVTHPAHAPLISTIRPEIMAHTTDDSSILERLLKQAQVIAIGPGLGQSFWAQSLFNKVLETDLPLVIDADGLNLLALQARQHTNWVLTPHPGEAARLLDDITQNIQADRFSAIRRLQTRYAGVVVLKGYGTIIADDTQQLSLCSDGNPGMATAGMGDVLTGIISAFIAQGIPLAEAARAGVCLHAAAADLIAHKKGERGMLAMDLMPAIRKLVNVPR